MALRPPAPDMQPYPRSMDFASLGSRAGTWPPGRAASMAQGSRVARRSRRMRSGPGRRPLPVAAGRRSGRVRRPGPTGAPIQPAAALRCPLPTSTVSAGPGWQALC